jgi:hypothetical protein
LKFRLKFEVQELNIYIIAVRLSSVDKSKHT